MTTLNTAVVSPMPKRQRQDGHGGEAGIASEHSKPVASVLAELIEPDGNPDVARRFLGAGDAAELAQRGIPGLARGHPAGDVVVGLALDVIANLAVEVRQGMLRHARFNTRPIASASRSQLDVSIASCLRPFAVNR